MYNNNNYLFDIEKKKREYNISNNSKNNAPICKNRHNFELVLFESIAGYKYHKRNKIIEIPIKKIEIKEEDSSYSESENNSGKEKEEKKKNDTKINFY